MDDKEYQEIKRRWGHKHSEINKLIAYCEELRVISTISETQISNLATLGERLEEENAKLKGLVFALRGHMEISSWTNKEQRLAQMNLELEEENAKLKEELQTFKDRWIGT